MIPHWVNSGFLVFSWKPISAPESRDKWFFLYITVNPFYIIFD